MRPTDVQRLIGTQGLGELSLFVTLGTYSRDAMAIELQRTGLRLISGEDIVGLVMDNYGALSPAPHRQHPGRAHGNQPAGSHDPDGP